jgi:hypothetical protein
MGFFVLWDIYIDMGKFIITEEEKKSIRGLYGLINEQTITLPLPIEDTFDSNDGDTAHNLKGFEKKIDIALEQIYNQGINPKMYDLSFNVVRNGNTFTTTSSLIIDKSDDGKAWTGFASRGAYGYDYVSRADGQISGSGNTDNKSLKQRLEEIGAVEIIPISNSPITINNNNVQIKQYFVQFTKSFKPSYTSSKSTPQPSQPKTQTGYEDYTDDEPTTPQPSQPKTQTTPTTPQNTVVEEFKISTTNLNTLYDDFKEKVNAYIIKEGNKNYNIHHYFSVSSKDGITINVEAYLYPDENGYNRFSLLFNEKGKSQESLELALRKNTGSKEIEKGTITVKLKGRGLVEHEWHLVGLHV